MIEESLASAARNAGQPKAPFLSFIISQRSIKLHGPIDLMNMYKVILEHDLSMIRSPSRLAALVTPLLDMRLDPKDPYCLGFGAQTCQSQGIETSPSIFAMRKTQDLWLLNFWMKEILPSLFNILDEAIGSDYSASLVREGDTEQLSSAVIRIESHAMPAQRTKKGIEQTLDKRCSMPLAALGIHIRFLRGALKLLAGERSAVIEHEEDRSADRDSQRLPYHTRYWKSPGMGASIGLLCTEEEFATLGCYVEINEEIFILTVDHFVDKSYRKLVAGINDTLTLTSPALAKVKCMKEELKPLFDSYLAEMNAGLTMKFGQGIVTSNEANKLSEDEDILSALKKYRHIGEWLEELEKDHVEFKVGSLLYRCKPSSTAALCQSSSTVAFDDATCFEEKRHRLDWALFKVDERIGTNQHRYPYDHDKETLVYSWDVEGKYSPEDTVQETGVVKANEQVYFEGQTSGRVNGMVNATLMGISYDGRKTLEHHVVVNKKQRKEAKEYKGDSGAAVLRVSDNKLIGLVWACAGEQPVFTPIHTIFKDINEGLPNDTVVRLPPARASRPPSPVTLLATNEADCCFGNEAERPGKRPLRPSDIVFPELDQNALAKESALIRQSLGDTTSPIPLDTLLELAKSGFSTKASLSSPVPSLSFSRTPSLDSELGSRSVSSAKLPCMEAITNLPAITGEISEDMLEMTSRWRLDKPRDGSKMHQPIGTASFQAYAL